MKIISEIGCNHKGDFELAKKMIKTAINYCGVDIVKFQKRSPRKLLSKKEFESPHPNLRNSYGKTYGEHREFLEFSYNQHAELKNLCESEGGIYSCSVWDIQSAIEISDLNPQMIKIPSAINTNFVVLDRLCRFYKGEIHISLGMTTDKEEKEIIQFLEKHNRLKDIVLYACVSDYPVSPDNIYLLELSRLKKLYEGKIKAFGYSGHHTGISVDLFIQNSHVDYIERHFTFDRFWKGTDHIASLEPHEFYRLKDNLEKIKKACKMRPKDVVDCELEQRKKLKKIVKLDN